MTNDANVFPFPSNGKAQADVLRVPTLHARRASFHSLQTGRHRQTKIRQLLSSHGMKVSIPFKREGTFRPTLNQLNTYLSGILGFNSLQTGRHIQTHLSPPCAIGTRYKGFHSLQTGRHIQTFLRSPQDRKKYLGFHSLQTGRHIQTGLTDTNVNRDGVKFVSIPFKREGTFRLQEYGSDQVNTTLSFHSLQTGRHIQTHITPTVDLQGTKFPFPSNGKAQADKLGQH